jgi:hypothetical protein
MTHTYLGQVALDQLAAAQRVIDKHVVDCIACGSARFCYDRIEAERVFLRYSRLPRRTPGLTRSGGDQNPGFGWLNPGKA